MDEYPITELLFERLVIFVCSTTGQGDQPDNMKKFWKFLLRKNLPSNSLQNVKFGVLGLGDSSYVKFNHVGKKLYRRLLNLGGQPICDLGLADDQHDLGADALIDPWINSLWNILLKIFPLEPGVQPVDTTSLLPARWDVNIISSESTESSKSIVEFLKWENTAPENSCIASVISNERITSANHFQDVRLLKLRIKDISYKPGDVAVIRPNNRPTAVTQLFNMLSENVCKQHLVRDTLLQVVQKDEDMPVPFALQQPITLEKCATEYWDLNAVPRRFVFQLLSKLTPSDMEREKLEEFSSAAGQEDLYNYCNRPRRNVLEVLSDFPFASANIPLEYLFEIFQPIRPRLFSIASSPKFHKEELHLLIAVVSYKTKLMAPRLGLCSNYLASLNHANSLPVSVRTGSFSFPQKSLPIIMVGPGTGIAPFRSFVWDKTVEGEANSEYLHLFFGCRNKEADFHCRSEWERLQSEGKISFYTAFSRDQSHKVYVQHIIEKEEVNLWKLLSRKDVHIYVAGNANNMPNSVREAFKNIYCKKSGLTNDECEGIFEKLELLGQYQTETWA
ncbi:NADPH-dependent diflavin oxidoreductase 1 isoform X2 [Lycorma delicatula]